MSEKKKAFNLKAYGIITFISVAVFLVLVCVFTFTSKYTAFHPEKVAENFVSTIVASGDGYNAYKNTILSKNTKYGDFIREFYIEPAASRDIAENEKAYSDNSFKGEKTLNDDGTLSGLLIEKMYPIYEELIDVYGWNDYDSIFSEYIKELIVVREEVFGDKFFNDEVFFSAFEANVSSYGKKLTGTQEVYDENSGVKLSDKTTGVYQSVYGEDYRFSVEVKDSREENLNAFKANADAEKYELYGITTDDISGVMTVDVCLSDGEKELAEIDVVLVKIGRSWYVDNTSTDTSLLYRFYK